MNIAIDLDEVLAEFLESFCEFHNKKYDTAIAPVQFKTYNFEDLLQITKQDIIKRVYEFHKTPLFADLHPVPGSQMGVNELCKAHKLHVVTSRQEYDVTVDATRKWMDHYFPRKFERIHFMNHYAKKGKEMTKEQVCRDFQIRLIIEDQLGYAQKCTEKGIDVLLLDKPWNQCEQLPDGATRVYSWKEIVEKI